MRDWRDWARTQAATEMAQRGTGFDSGSDDGSPSLDSLCIEVDWLVEDAVAGIRDHAPSDGDGAWRELGRAVRLGGLPAGGRVLLREELDQLRRMWTRRLRERVPVQYITGSCHWRDFVFVVTPAVLIPRPETELMVDFAADALKRRPALADSPWLDLGTGSGALAIGIAAEIARMKRSRHPAWSVGAGEDDAIVHAVDLSPAAAAVARRNAARNAETTGGGGGGVRVHEGSWYQPLKSLVLAQASAHEKGGDGGCFAGIVSNPPYIPSADMPMLQPEVRLHEPWLALEGGTGLGLDAMLPICAGAAVHLLPGGFLALETNGGEQARDVVSVLDGLAVFEDIQIRRDYCGIDRFVTAYRRSQG